MKKDTVYTSYTNSLIEKAEKNLLSNKKYQKKAADALGISVEELIRRQNAVNRMLSLEVSK